MHELKINFNAFIKQRQWFGWWWATACSKDCYYATDCELCDQGSWCYSSLEKMNRAKIIKLKKNYD